MKQLGINKTILVGHVEGEPQIRVIAKNEEYLALFVIITSRENVDGERIDTRHNVYCKGEIALYCKDKISDGSNLYAEGALEYYQERHEQYKKLLIDKTRIRIRFLQVL